MAVTPQWVWELLDAHGAGLSEPRSPVFTARFDAEAWLGESWRRLATRGVRAARLLHDGHPAGPVVPIPRGSAVPPAPGGPAVGPAG